MASKGYPQLSWYEARDECKQHPGNYDLAIIDSQEIFDAVKEYASLKWIGLHDMFSEGLSHWVNGQEIKGFGSEYYKAPWDEGEPDVRYLVCNYIFEEKLVLYIKLNI